MLRTKKVWFLTLLRFERLRKCRIGLGLTSLSLIVTACASGNAQGDTTEPGAGNINRPLELVQPPFEVRGEVDGLLLTWFDPEGSHLARNRAAIPANRRAEVRVDSLDLAPEDRDPDHVFVADLREAREDGSYPVQSMTRGQFDALVDGVAAEAREALAQTAEEVIVFGASWCGACRQTKSYLSSRGIPFVERDVEREPGAQRDMMDRAQRAGVSPSGIPVIDFRGRIIQGFNRAAIDRAIQETESAPGTQI